MKVRDEKNDRILLFTVRIHQIRVITISVSLQ